MPGIEVAAWALFVRIIDFIVNIASKPTPNKPQVLEAVRMLAEAWSWGYLPCLLAVLVLCSVTLTWDTPLFTPYREHYVAQAHFQGVDVFTEALHSPVGPEKFMEHFYVCYGRDGRKTYFKKQDQNYFSNRRYWVMSSTGKFVASMRTC